MSKLSVALLVLCIAYAAQGCSDTCVGKRNGANYPSWCGPCNYYYKCVKKVVVYKWCVKINYCIINGFCRRCGDTCEGKPDGLYPSVNRKRPAYYQCDGGELYYRSCEAFQVFNPWTKKCQCFEGACLHGDGWRSSFCRGKGWRVFCRRGYPVRYYKCPSPRPYVCCVTYQCVSTCVSYYGKGYCCRN